MTNTALQHTTLRAQGFSCPSCVSKIEKQVQRLPGVEKVEVKFASSRVEVDHAESVTPEDLVAAVRKAGYESSPSVF
ncbi:heavy-metal-associated domain-containing protein [Kytococcus sedentarius]|uniref:Heavy-metal-associated domain-containing protein n=2 Tax=Kytococcus TaxID=57499 RepID=A0A212T8K2_9MICO|nr:MULTISPECIES: heavy metal-associated domain-containing protein [Kytococcus]ACV07009.1 cation transport ATPase [Kytococcus sedentarius DSM 20547]QQB63007.1 heavy-metal-associated domain-containing protein [Kytococcus sedentarius]SNC62387.1 Heavy-metal-associated domain-containing protein [Kytococcus aerolatus]STX14163.1 Cation-transporting ATPase PacS [Kytococcus sedentarius]